MRALILLLAFFISVVAHAATYPITCSGVDHGTIGQPDWTGGTVEWPDGTPPEKVNRSLAGYLCPPCAQKQQEDMEDVEHLRLAAQEAIEAGKYDRALALLAEARRHRTHIYGAAYPTDARLLEIADHARREQAREQRLATPLRRAGYFVGVLALLCVAVWLWHMRRLTRLGGGG